MSYINEQIIAQIIEELEVAILQLVIMAELDDDGTATIQMGKEQTNAFMDLAAAIVARRARDENREIIKMGLN